MGKTLYTKGPWEVKESETKPAFNVVGTALGGRYKIARCPYLLHENGQIRRREEAEALANAQLIAAAPDMLDALERLKRFEPLQGVPGCTYGDTDYDSESAVFGYNVCLQQVQQLVRSTLARATGKKEETTHES